MKKLKNIYNALYIVWEASHGYIIFKILLSNISVIMNLLNLFLLKYILEALNKSIKTVLFLLIIYMVTIITLQIICIIIDERFLPICEEKVKYKIEMDLYNEAEKKEISLFDNSKFYNQYFFVLTNSKINIMDLANNIIILFNQIILSISLIGIIISYDFLVIFIIFIFLIFDAFINLYKSKIMHNKFFAMISNDRRINYINRVFYLKNYAAEIRIFHFFNIFRTMYRKAVDNKIKIIRKHSKKIIRASFMESLSQNILQFILLLYMSIKVFSSNMLISNFIVIYNGVVELNDQLLAIISTLPSIYSNSLYIDHYLDFFEHRANNYNILLDHINSIDIEKLSFSYNNNQKILKQVNLHIKKGEPTVIIGANGSGKTTLIKCICGIYKEQEGKIYYNNQILDNFLIKDKCSVIFQDFQLYATTIANNIIPEDINSEEKERRVIEALSIVGLYDKIRKLKNGIYTEVSHEFEDDDAISLSGGECQKIAIARAIAKNSDIIILDEPTSSLDFISEKKMFELLNKIFKDKILIYVTHRLDVVKSVKHVLLVNKGNVINIGSYSNKEKEKIISSAFCNN